VIDFGPVSASAGRVLFIPPAKQLSYKPMKRFFPALLSLPLFFTALPASAQGLLVKGSTPAVYFVSEGKRYAFPNESVYKSWFKDYSSVTQVSDHDLASYQLAANVTYRPGAMLIKVATDPKVYAVSRYGVLHWVATEDIAKTLYGADWNTKVADVADTFFINYLVGNAITSANLYSATQELAGALTPGDNVKIPGVQPPLTLTPQSSQSTNGPLVIFLSLGMPEAVINQTIPLEVSVTGGSSVISKIELYKESSSTPLATCLATTRCVYPYTTSAAGVEIFYAKITLANGDVSTVGSGDRITLTTLPAATQLQLSATPDNTNSGNRVSWSSNVMNGLKVSRHRVLALIPGEAKPVLWKDCGTDTVCAASNPFYRTTSLYSQVVTIDGQTLVSAAKQITVIGEAPKPVLISKALGNNQVEIQLQAPTGESIGMTALVDGQSIDDKTLALCSEATCSITLQINIPGFVRAFTWVGGKYEASNVVQVMPQ
jgi:hypothetical protein